MAFQVSKTSADCLEFSYKVKRSDGSIQELSFLLTEEDSKDLLKSIEKGESFFKQEVHSFLRNVVERYNDDDYLFPHVITALASDDSLRNNMVQTKGLFKNIMINGTPLDIVSLGARNEVQSLNELKTVLGNISSGPEGLTMAKFLVDRAEEISLLTTKNLNVVFTNGYITKAYTTLFQPTIKLIGQDYHIPSKDEYKAGVYLSVDKSNPVIFARSANYFKNKEEALTSDATLTVLNHELIHFVFDNHPNRKEIFENLKIFWTQARKELETKYEVGTSAKIHNVDEFLAYFLAGNELQKKLSSDLVEKVDNLMMNYLSTPIYQDGTEDYLNQYEKIKPLVAKTLKEVDEEVPFDSGIESPANTIKGSSKRELVENKPMTEGDKFDLGSFIVSMQLMNNNNLELTVDKWLTALRQKNPDLTKQEFNDMLDEVLTHKFIKRDAEGVIEDVREIGNAWFDASDNLGEESDGIAFMEEPEIGFFESLEDVSFKKADWPKSAKELFRRFNRSIRKRSGKDGEVIKDYSISYGEFTEIGDKSKDMSGYRQLFNLQQGDLIYYSFTPKDSKKALSIPRPILFSSLNKEGKMYFALAANDAVDKNNVQFVSADEVIGFRRNYGTPAIGFDNTSKTLLEEIYEDNVRQKITDEDGNLTANKEDTVFYSFKNSYTDESGSEIEYTKLKAKDSLTSYVSFNANDSYDRVHLSSLVRGDLVKLTFKKKEDVYIDYYAPVVKVIGNTVETVIKLSNGDYVSKYTPKKDIKGALLLKENHKEDLIEKGISKLREIEKTGRFFQNSRHAFKKMSFVNYNPDGTRDTESPNWNDLEEAYGRITKQGKTWADYTKWRKDLGEDKLSEMKLVEIPDALTKEYYKMVKALERRNHLTSIMKFGDLIQVDRPKMKKVGDVYVPVEGQVQHSPAMVVSQNGNWLNVMMYKSSFGPDESDEGSGSKLLDGQGTVYFKKIRINQAKPEAKEYKDKNGVTRYSQVMSIRAIYFDNSAYRGLIDYFHQMKLDFKENFADRKEYFELLKARQPIPENLARFNLPALSARVTGEQDFELNYDGLGTKIADRYDIEFFPDDITQDERLKAIASLKPGNIVFRKGKTLNEGKDGEKKVPYTTSIVVDKDPITGKVMIGYKEEKYGQYTVIPLNESSIIGYGTSMLDDTITYEEEKGAERLVIKLDGDKAKKERMERLIKSFKKFKQSIYLDTYKEAEEWVAKNAGKLPKDKINIEEVYETVDGKKTIKKPTTPHKILYSPTIKRFSKVKDEWYTERLKDSDHWNSLYAKNLTNVHKDNLWEFVMPGDILTRTFLKDGKKVYADYVIMRKTKDTMTMRSMHKDYKGDGDAWAYKDHFMFFYNTKKFDDIHSIHLHKSNHNYEKSSEIIAKLEKKEIPKYNPLPAYQAHRGAGSSIPDNTRKTITNTIRPTEKKTDSRPVTPPVTTPSFRSMTGKISIKSSKSIDFKSNAVGFKKVKMFGDKLKAMYNTEILYLNSDQITEQFPAGDLKATHRAFVTSDNVVVINTDFASLAEPIHELGHLIMDGLKKSSPQLFNAILDKVKTHDLFETIISKYPELDEEEAAVEAFLTVSAEHFNQSVGNTRKDYEFVDNNPGLFKRFFNAVKNWIARFIGTDDKDFFTLDGEDLMEMSFNELFDRYNTTVMSGKFTTQVELAKLNQRMKFDGKYPKDSDIFNSLVESGLSEEESRDIWLATHTENYIKWRNLGEVVEDPAKIVASDKVYYRLNIDTISDTFSEDADPVFVKGELTESKGNFKITNVEQVKSVHSVFNNPKHIESGNDIATYALSTGIALIGDYDLLSKNAKLLSEKFKDLEFYVDSIGSSNFIGSHVKPTKRVSELKNILYQNNLLKTLC